MFWLKWMCEAVFLFIWHWKGESSAFTNELNNSKTFNAPARCQPRISWIWRSPSRSRAMAAPSEFHRCLQDPHCSRNAWNARYFILRSLSFCLTPLFECIFVRFYRRFDESICSAVVDRACVCACSDLACDLFTSLQAAAFCVPAAGWHRRWCTCRPLRWNQDL